MKSRSDTEIKALKFTGVKNICCHSEISNDIQTVYHSTSALTVVATVRIGNNTVNFTVS